MGSCSVAVESTVKGEKDRPQSNTCELLIARLHAVKVFNKREPIVGYELPLECVESRHSLSKTHCSCMLGIYNPPRRGTF